MGNTGASTERAGTVNQEQQHVYNALSVTEYTAAREFVPRIHSSVDGDDVHRILLELESAGLAELCYGWGWRAVQSEHSKVDPDMQRQIDVWREQVASGATMLDFKRWFINEIVKFEKEQEGR